MAGFWRDRRVLVTGHTGFKGAWLCLWLERLGARVTAFALPPQTRPSLYALASPWTAQSHADVDVRDSAAVAEAVRSAAPEVVFHLAAQSLVRPSYRDPVETYATNLMGTVHLLDAVRRVAGVRAIVAVTTDKVYENEGAGRPFCEDDRLGGGDPYSNSKACCELAVEALRDAFFREAGAAAVATVRAGNVIGGGDWADERLVPDVVRAAEEGQPVLLRYPHAVRPWQHVLEPLRGYLTLAERLTEAPGGAPEALNFGPDPGSFLTVAEVAEAMGKALGMTAPWRQAPGDHPKEAATLTLDSALARRSLGWRPLLSAVDTNAWTADWYRRWRDGADARRLCLEQIARYEDLCARGGA